MTQINIDETVFEIIEKYPVTLDIFISQGFNNFADKAVLENFGKKITLRNALIFKQINQDSFTKMLTDAIDEKDTISDHNVSTAIDGNETLQVTGLLPCPVRLPLVEELNSFIESNQLKNIKFDLKAASMGLDWLKNDLKKGAEADDLADVFISAGFDLFFDNKLFGRHKNSGVFRDTTKLEKWNSMFSNAEIDLRDPKKHYSMISVVPAVFLVNTTELNGREIPKSWKDILKPEFRKSISLPVADFDLFNAILLNIHKEYGTEGIEALGQNLMKSMHPSQMIKEGRKVKPEKPVVTIMPYFFTKMVREGDSMMAVWPEDGAIISPIFMLIKDSSADKTQALVDFFISEKIGEVLAHQGLFPSVNPNIDNRIDKKNKFMWLGWDYIYSQDIPELIAKCESIFTNAAEM
jgi:ABC-type Fe3+ transport system substrate-binding protein